MKCKYKRRKITKQQFIKYLIVGCWIKNTKDSAAEAVSAIDRKFLCLKFELHVLFDVLDGTSTLLGPFLRIRSNFCAHSQ